MNINNFKSVLVLGSGITGLSVCKFLLEHNVQVYLADDNLESLRKCALKVIKIEEIKTFDFKLIDSIVISPGIRTLYNPHSIKQLAIENNKLIYTDFDILQILYPVARYIGITGTNGKSTTVSMLDHVLKTNKVDVFTAGNIGIPMLSIDKEYKYILLELSSYQLENALNLKIDLGVIINLYPSHLDHHGDMQKYLLAKARIASETCLINGDNLDLRSKVKNKDLFSTEKILEKGISVVNNIIYNDSHYLAKIDDFINAELPFKYHPQNVACVFWIAIKMGLKIDDIVLSLKSYKPLAHRTEPIKKIGRILFINDSKATNIPAAIKGITENQNLILIMGGKLLTDYSALPAFFSLKNNIKKVFLIGEAQDFLQQKMNENNIENEICGTLQSAFKSAYKKAIQLTKNNKNDQFIVMLCPMHPSTDQFVNFEERGDVFKHLVNLL